MTSQVEPWNLEPGTQTVRHDFIEVAESWVGGHVRVTAEARGRLNTKAPWTTLRVDGPLTGVHQNGDTLELTVGILKVSTADWFINDFERLVP